MSHDKRKYLFKDNQTGYHRAAVNILAEWVCGQTEQPFYVNEGIIFVPDVVVYKEGILDSIYEVIYMNAFRGRKLGFIEYWCYVNAKDLSVFEVSADWILSQKEKPERIETMECYEINFK